VSGLRRVARRVAVVGLCALAGCDGEDAPSGNEQGESARPPELLRSFNLARPSGRVIVRLCNGRRVELTRTINVAFGCTVVDARRGAVAVVTARDRSGRTQRARFNAGVFRVVQERSGLTEVILVGGDFGRCRARARKEVGEIRALLGDGAGDFRTRGNFGAATIRGTKWGTRDFCDGTLLIVREGRIAVRDLVRDRTIRLEAPGRYFARAPG
jgi:hypothetical protein